MVWSPLSGGFLSGKFTRDATAPKSARRASFDFPPVDKERAFDVVDVMRDIATKKKASVAQIALAWLLAQPHVTTVIIGAKNIEQLDDNLGATSALLEDVDLRRLDAAGALTPEYPAWMIERQGAERLPK
jgi:aryl-alcohol dehydrogenase-like predicted oxidoreductase